MDTEVQQIKPYQDELSVIRALLALQRYEEQAEVEVKDRQSVAAGEAFDRLCVHRREMQSAIMEGWLKDHPTYSSEVA